MRHKEIAEFNSEFQVEIITTQNINLVCDLQNSNTYYLQSIQSPLMTQDECLLETTELPPEKKLEDKTYVLFMKNKKAIAILDFIEGYSNAQTGYIGLFMIHHDVQGLGIGKSIMNNVIKMSKSIGLSYLELGCAVNNHHGFQFWTKLNFHEIKRSTLMIHDKPQTIISLQYKL